MACFSIPLCTVHRELSDTHSCTRDLSCETLAPEPAVSDLHHASLLLPQQIELEQRDGEIDLRFIIQPVVSVEPD
jgi:hypothetical protein